MAHTPDDAAPMRREHAFYSHWCQLFDFHLRRLRWSATDFALKAGVSQQAVHSYLCGRLRPPLRHVPVWAVQLGLRGEERDRFVSSAMEAHVPALVWKRLQELERAAKVAAPPPPPSELQNRVHVLEAIVGDLVQLLTETEALFYTRTVPLDLIRGTRDKLQAATRRAIERYARASPDVEN